MRADRLISILMMLRVHQRLTARELAERLECSERTILRDMAALTLAGVPVAAERGAGGGWYLSEPYETRLTGLNLTELDALFVESRPGRVLRDLGLSSAFEGALGKLLAAVPTLSRGQAEKARQRVYVDADGWQKFEEDLSALPELQRALWQERRVQITYFGGNGITADRLCDPLGLVIKGRIWYFVAQVDSDIRAYRVARIQDAVVQEAAAPYPESFDLAAYWEKSQQELQFTMPRCLADVRVAPDILTAFRKARNVKIAEEQGIDSRGWSLLRVDFETVGHALENATIFGQNLEILSPPELRAELKERLQALVQLYS